ncbi:MAG: cellobiohydrolase [Catenulispora sp.]|nr:cellobiohydrolase [Catenulispora sp.]
MFSGSSSLGSAGRRGLGAAVAAATAVAGLVLATQLGGVAMAGTIGSGTQFYSDPNSQVVKWDAANPGDSREPAIASRIGSIPQGIWFSNYRPSTVQSDVSAVTTAAAAAGKTPVLVVYEIPNRDCGGASAGGAPDLGSYQNYIQSFANGLGSHQVIIILEPDSLALQTCLSAQQATDRDNAIASAVSRLKSADPAAKVYLDAGHSSWNSPSSQAATLNSAGVRSSDGIFSNVSNFMTTASEVSYDKQVLGALGNPSNLHIVVDTSRNGNGPAAGNPWCDPSGRALGQNPTANTGDAAVDAYLWIKPPGESDGCADAAGTFDPALAYALITNGGPPPTTPSTTPSSTPPTTPTAPKTTPSSSTSTTSGGACHIAYTRTNEWGGGYTANIDITSSKALSSWTVGFTYGGDQQVTQSWNSNHTQSGKNVTLTNLSYNGTIGAGQTLTGVGVQGTWGSSDAAPTAFTLNGVACS